jgi:hypothetical protein
VAPETHLCFYSSLFYLNVFVISLFYFIWIFCLKFSHCLSVNFILISRKFHFTISQYIFLQCLKAAALAADSNQAAAGPLTSPLLAEPA